MRQLSLKWHIFLFYVLLGFIPMAAISYFAVASYTRSINTLTDDYLTQLVRQTAEQTESLGRTYFRYLDILVKFPFVQLSFHQFPSGMQLSAVQEKLELFRVNTESFDRITLFANDGHAVATTPDPTADMAPGLALGADVLLGGTAEYHHRVDLSAKPPELLLFRRVYDFQDPARSVGVVGAAVALDKLMAFARQLNPGPGIEKAVHTADGVILYREAAPGEDLNRREKAFAAPLPSLGWTMRVAVPESLLLKDVDRLASRMFLFSALVALAALAASLAASRAAVKPLIRIGEGIKIFASGNLAHRIRGIYGVETRRMADAFNTMAEELQRRQQELIQAHKMASLGLMSAGFAHEVRNPLAGIKTSAQVIGKRSHGEEIKKLADGISKEVDRLNKLVADLLQFSRPRPADRRECDLVDIIHRCLKILDYEIRKKQVRIINKVARHHVRVAPDQMVQVLINLMLNALNAVAPETGEIRLRSKVGADRAVTLILEDNGCGISGEKIAHIFDPFFSLSKEGTGLGLSVVQMLLANNDIRVDVESAEGEGTRFLMHFTDRSLPPKRGNHG